MMVDNASANDSSKQQPIKKRWRRAMPVWLQGLILLVVFASGIGVGAVGTSRYIMQRMQRYRDAPDQFPAEITSSLSRQLQLTDAQEVQVRQRIAARHQRITAIRNASSPEILAEFDMMRAEVAEVLDEEQRQRWEQTAAWVRDTFLPRTPDSYQ